MLVVADASVLVTALSRFDDEGNRIRTWLTNLSDGAELDVVRNFTRLDFMSALRRLNQKGHVPDQVAEDAIRNFTQLPHRAREITQPMAVRIWELRPNLTVYDAAYIALVERLMSAEGPTVLATSDTKLANAPGISIPIELFS